jgi:recombination protein RecT
MALELATTKNKNLVYSMRDKFIEITKNETLFEREAGFAIQTLNNNSYLAGCDQNSILTAVYNIALTGLTLNPLLKFAYLVPRGGKCVLDISYVGMVKLLTDYGVVRNVVAEVVYANDRFKVEMGQKPIFRHVPNYTSDRGDPVAVYAIGYFHAGGNQFEIMTMKEITAIQNRSESVKAGKGSPWKTDFSEMAKKTVIRRLFKYLPKSAMPDNVAIGVSKAIEIDNENNSIDFEGEQKATKKGLNDDLFAVKAPVKMIEEAEVAPTPEPVQETKQPQKAEKPNSSKGLRSEIPPPPLEMKME